MEQMTPKQAYDLVNQALSQIPASRQQHMMLIQAVNILYGVHVTPPKVIQKPELLNKDQQSTES